jgi:hypothetical protein
MEGVTIAIVFGVNLLLIAAIVGLVHWLGRSVKARLDSAEAATALFRIEFPQSEIAEIVLTGAGDGALLALADTPAIGLVAALGAHWLVRKIEPQNFGTASVAGGSKIVLRISDFTAPRLTLDLGTAQQAALWCDRLEALRARRPVPAARLSTAQA